MLTAKALRDRKQALALVRIGDARLEEREEAFLFVRWWYAAAALK
jgi:hypothetical protein